MRRWGALAILGLAACAADELVLPDASTPRDASTPSDASTPGDASTPSDAGPRADAAVRPATWLRNVDVTVVYPLPTSAGQDAWMAASSPALDGDLLPLAELPDLDVRAPLPTDAARLASLRVVALRFDPCGRQLATPTATCHAELRLVFQSLLPDGAARDGAVHAFYQLDDAQREAVLAGLRALRAEREADPPVPLGVHPRLLAEGPGGDLGRRLQALVLAHTGNPNLVRITRMRRTAEHPSWEMTIWDRPGGHWTAATIPTTTTTVQHLRTIAGGRWDADVTPALTHADDPTRLFDVPPAQAPAAFGATVRVLDPRTHSSESVDCASCHLAPDIAIFARETMSLRVEDDPAHFVSSYPLDHAEKDVGEAIGFENLHMSSYLGRSLGLAARTVNETARVLEQVNGD